MKIRRVVAGLVMAVLAVVGVRYVTAVDTTGQGWNETYDTVSVTVTNGSTLGLIFPKMIVTPTGQANNGTNTVTLATPFPFKFPVVIMLPSTATNALKIAEGAVFQHPGGIILDVDTVTNAVIIIPCSTNVAVAIR